MIRPNERDKSVDALLRAALRPRSTDGPSKECLAAETVVAWADGTLTSQDAARAEVHLSTCARCQEIVAAFARTAPADVAGASLWHRWRLQWAVPIAAAAAAAAIWVAVPRESPEEILERTAESPAAPAPLEPDTKSQDRTSTGQTPQQPLRADGARRSDETARQERDESEEKQGFADRNAAADRIASLPEAAPAPAAPPPATGAAAQERRGAALLRQTAAVEVVSRDPMNRWRLGASGDVERSTDGGTSWTPASVDEPGLLTAGSSPAPLVCWLVGPGGRVRLTTDGTRFQVVSFPQSVDLVSVLASSSTGAIITTADGRRFRTEDQGRTWNLLQP